MTPERSAKLRAQIEHGRELTDLRDLAAALPDALDALDRVRALCAPTECQIGLHYPRLNASDIIAALEGRKR